MPLYDNVDVVQLISVGTSKIYQGKKSHYIAEKFSFQNCQIGRNPYKFYDVAEKNITFVSYIF